MSRSIHDISGMANSDSLTIEVSTFSRPFWIASPFVDAVRCHYQPERREELGTHLKSFMSPGEFKKSL